MTYVKLPISHEPGSATLHVSQGCVSHKRAKAVVTGSNIEKRFAIILDDRVENAPVIKSKIGGGSGEITMGAGSQQKQAQAAPDKPHFRGFPRHSSRLLEGLPTEPCASHSNP